jgi:hypothetical protein
MAAWKYFAQDLVGQYVRTIFQHFVSNVW